MSQLPSIIGLAGLLHAGGDAAEAAEGTEDRGGVIAVLLREILTGGSPVRGIFVVLSCWEGQREKRRDRMREDSRPLPSCVNILLSSILSLFGTWASPEAF